MLVVGALGHPLPTPAQPGVPRPQTPQQRPTRRLLGGAILRAAGAKDVRASEASSKRAAAAFDILMSPTAIALVPRTAAAVSEAGAVVPLDGGASTPIWGTALTSFAWEAQQGADASTKRSAQGRNASLLLPPGEWTVRLTVRDSNGDAGTDAAKVTVVPFGGPAAAGGLAEATVGPAPPPSPSPTAPAAEEQQPLKPPAPAPSPPPAPPAERVLPPPSAGGAPPSPAPSSPAPEPVPPPSPLPSPFPTLREPAAAIPPPQQAPATPPSLTPPPQAPQPSDPPAAVSPAPSPSPSAAPGPPPASPAAGQLPANSTAALYARVWDKVVMPYVPDYSAYCEEAANTAKAECFSYFCDTLPSGVPSTPECTKYWDFCDVEKNAESPVCYPPCELLDDPATDGRCADKGRTVSDPEDGGPTGN